MRPWAARLCVALCATGIGVAAAAPPAYAREVEVRIEEMPDEFASGALPEVIRVVATQSSDEDCTKVRFSMLMRLTGIQSDDVRVDRVEEDDVDFPVLERPDGDATRFTDQQFDPGELCDDRTVTGRWEVNFAQLIPDGRVTFELEAYDEDEQLLGRDTAVREVRGDPDAEPTESPSPTPESEPEPIDTGAGAPVAGGQLPVDNSFPMPPLGFVIGAVLLIVGGGLLLHVRRGLRRAPIVRPRPAPTGYPRRARPLPRR